MRQARWDGMTLATVWFQRRPLPPWAILLDVAARSDYTGIAEDDPESPFEFWWAFCVCVGRWRDESSEVLIGHARRLSALIRERDNTYSDLLQKTFPADPEIVLADWMQSLDIIVEEARIVKQCHWYGGYQGSGPYSSNPALAPRLEELAHDAAKNKAPSH